ncbi:MAG: hypothetical protein WCS88_00120 [Patescibacteria group bacterium]|jgi:hypothetical protein
MKKLLIILFLPIFISGCFNGSGVGKTEKFSKPDIKDDFCGVQINFQYCKCAFHDEFCEAIGLDQDAANAYVEDEFDKWLNELIEAFGTACQLNGGIPQGEKCQYCKEGYHVQDSSCVEDSEESDKVEEFKADGPLTNSCEIIEEEFNNDWKKYSDIDNAIDFEARSYEAKQAVTAYDQMIALMVEGFELERDFEIEKQMQDELLEYRSALVQNLKTNLLKAFWRLSWVTYTTVNSGTSLGKSYSELLTSVEGISAIGTGLKVVQGIIPSDSQLAIDTSNTAGKAKSVGANVALEAVESLGDPTKIATELFKSAANAPLPSADISEEEINVLREQHLSKGAVDEILAASQAANDARLVRINEIEEGVARLQEEIDKYEAEEKARVRFNLEDSCQTLKQRWEEENN